MNKFYNHERHAFHKKILPFYEEVVVACNRCKNQVAINDSKSLSQQFLWGNKYLKYRDKMRRRMYACFSHTG